MLVPLVHASTGNVPTNVRFTRFALVPCCGCTLAQCVPCLYLLPVFVLVPCVYYCTVGTGNVRFTRFVLVPCVHYCTVSPGNVRFTRFVLVPCCGCTIAPRFVLAPCVDYCTVSTSNVRFTRFVLVPCCGCTIAPCVGDVPFTRFCTRVVRVLLHGASMGRVLIGQVRTRAVAVPLHGVYRACTVISSHSCWTSTSFKGSAISFLGLGVEFVYQRFFFVFFWKYKYIYIPVYNTLYITNIFSRDRTHVPTC